VPQIFPGFEPVWKKLLAAGEGRAWLLAERPISGPKRSTFDVKNVRTSYVRKQNRRRTSDVQTSDVYRTYLSETGGGLEKIVGRRAKAFGGQIAEDLDGAT